MFDICIISSCIINDKMFYMQVNVYTLPLSKLFSPFLCAVAILMRCDVISSRKFATIRLR